MSLEIIKLALAEDLEPDGDITSLYTVPASAEASARLIAKDTGVLAGSEVAAAVVSESAKLLGAEAKIEFFKADSEPLKPGDEIARLSGKARVLLVAERTLLNFMQRLSGIASKTKKLVNLINNYDVELLDTRKTTPGLRALEKKAFLAGGGTAHRYNLSDAVLIKENHLRFGEINESLVKKIRNEKPGTKIELEIASLEELERALKLDLDVIMFDNFSPNQIKQALAKLDRDKIKIKFEASGGINETNIIDYAASGVDYISTGAVYHHASSLDLALDGVSN